MKPLPFLLALTCALSACKPQTEKHVEITSSLRGTRVYLDDKYIGQVPIKLSEHKLKELGFAYPYTITSGNEQWDAWDLDIATGSAITVQNDPHSKIAGRFRFQANPHDPRYRSLKEGNSEWLIFGLNSAPIGSKPGEKGLRLNAIPIEDAGRAATAP